MHDVYRPYPCPYCSNIPNYHSNHMYPAPPCPYLANRPENNPELMRSFPHQAAREAEYNSLQLARAAAPTELRDYGPDPFVIDIEEATERNNTFRTALWTGDHLQLTLMSIPVGGDIGLEVHPDLDQFIRLEEGQGLVKMGDRKDRLDFQEKVYGDFIFIIPAGKWHNLINTGQKPIKLYSIYAPPAHSWGTVHETKSMAEAGEGHYNNYVRRRW